MDHDGVGLLVEVQIPDHRRLVDTENPTPYVGSEQRFLLDSSWTFKQPENVEGGGVVASGAGQGTHGSVRRAFLVNGKEL